MLTHIPGLLEDFVTYGWRSDISTPYFICWTCVVTGFISLVVILLTQLLVSRIEIDNITKRSVFITGCDSGFGNSLARSLDAKGVRVFAGCLTQKGADGLRDEASRRLNVVIIDVTKKESVQHAFDFVKENVGYEGLWGLVNNAGIMPTYCPIEWTGLESIVATCNVNLFGTISVTLQFLPLLRRRGGRVVNVCSVTANFPYPGIIDYSVSKAAAKSFSVGLRRELISSGISVHTIEPGGYNTSIANGQRLVDAFLNAYKHAPPDTKDYYGGNIAKNLLGGMKLVNKFVNKRNHEVTDAMTHALLAKYPKRSYLLGYDSKSFFRFLRLVPESVADFIVGWPKPYGEKIPELKALD